METATTEDDKKRIFVEYSRRESARMEAEGVELAQLFGGRLHYVVDEFRRRGLLGESDASQLRWEASSRGWIRHAAQKIEALALRL